VKLLGPARATLRTTFLPRSDLRRPRLFLDLRFLVLRLVRRLRSVAAAKARLNRGLQKTPNPKLQRPEKPQGSMFQKRYPTFGLKIEASQELGC
jgi:hypothetical protein